MPQCPTLPSGSFRLLEFPYAISLPTLALACFHLPLSTLSWQDGLLNLSLWSLLSFPTHDTDILITYAYPRHEKVIRMCQKRKASAAVIPNHFQK